MDHTAQPVCAAIFDLDGTLVDTYELILTSFRHATREVMDRVIPDEVLMARVGVPLASQMADFTDDPAVQERLVAVYRTFNHAHHDELIHTFEGVAHMLDDLLARGMRVGVVTSKFSELAWRGLRAAGLDGRVEFLIGSDQCQKHKPLPDPVLAGCEKLGLAPGECVYVGDSPFDIAAGNAAGCRTVAVTWGMFPRKVLEAESPTWVCTDPDQLAKVLE